MAEKRTILGIAVDDVTIDEAVAWVLDHALASPCRQVVTVNPEFIMAAQRNRAFADVLNAADLSVPDGAGLIWAARWLRSPLRQRVAGVDLVDALARQSARRGLRLYFLGAQPGVAAQAACVLAERYAGLIVAGSFAGSPSPGDESAILERVTEASPHVLLVAYGAPQQDLWIARNRARIPAGIAMGVGGSFDFISGRVRRAPGWMQELGLEWLFRLWHEPWRWRRMLALPRFVWAIVRAGRIGAGRLHVL
jgi:N-acetylglucosaminyldiphosphoundecaprenol N-acetyl-beta-D-mannosaminyltransferase